MTSEQLLRECTVLNEREELPEVREVYPLVAEFEKQFEKSKGVGSALYLIIDGGNLADDVLDECVAEANLNDDAVSEALAKVIRRMPEASRGAL